MFRNLFLFTLFSALLVASSNYTVRLAAYKDAKELHKIIATYPPALKKTVKTYKKKGLTFAYTLPTADKRVLKKLLPAYRKVFKDAYIQPTRLK